MDRKYNLFLLNFALSFRTQTENERNKTENTNTLKAKFNKNKLYFLSRPSIHKVKYSGNDETEIKIKDMKRKIK